MADRKTPEELATRVVDHRHEDEWPEPLRASLHARVVHTLRADRDAERDHWAKTVAEHQAAIDAARTACHDLESLSSEKQAEIESLRGRVDELLQANNEELERRRKAEAEIGDRDEYAIALHERAEKAGAESQRLRIYLANEVRSWSLSSYQRERLEDLLAGGVCPTCKGTSYNPKSATGSDCPDCNGYGRAKAQCSCGTP